jgi:hypothetical protein
MPQIVQAVPVAKANYHDRNARPTIHRYAANVGPHAPTQRVSFTAASPYAAYIEVGFLYVLRSTAAAAGPFVESYLTYTPFFGGVYNLMYIFTTQNAALAIDQRTLTNFGILLIDDNYSFYTADASTGGDNTYNQTIKGTEFEY